MTQHNPSNAESAISRKRRILRSASGAAAAALCLLGFVLLTSRVNRAQEAKPSSKYAPIDFRQTQPEADSRSTGCVSCHGMTEAATMHPTGTIRIGCADCHGGDPAVMMPAGTEKGVKPYEEAKRKAHPKPEVPELWKSSANPVRAQMDWMKESKEYIRFVNPGDLRVADMTCGTAGCHAKQVHDVRTSMMTHGGMLWQAALYNNGGSEGRNRHAVNADSLGAAAIHVVERKAAATLGGG